ncbi:TetR family transcriptional regulator C-terminal domain-containing protein [Flavobacterium sp.]|uniref:TetR family transcriptional regulator C-terminal domain-containing protein n=1 Tax=Flavobacterium sp. TaxID=239 RepID=UPI0035272695
MTTRKKKLTAEIISEKYIAFVLANGKKPNSVYEFAKNNGFEEAEFYQFFTSFEQIEQAFFKQMFDYSISMIQKSDNYEAYDAKQKLSVFYFTFFEVATANRSFVNYLLVQEKNKLIALSKLKSLRSSYLEFVKSILENPIKSDIEKFNKVQSKVLIEGAWVQFLSILKYWLDDTSANFEKTDIFIEKSVKASFDVLYNVPFESVLDFGKFLWKEKINR